MGVWAKIKWVFGWPSRLLKVLFRPVDVLVLGSAHIDTTGELQGSAFTTGLDHEGRIVYSVGGSGYNVAVNLAAAGANRRIALNTLLPKDSRLADLVTAKLDLNGVSLAYVRRFGARGGHAEEFIHAAMGGHVAIRARDDTISSVSRTLVNTPEFYTRGRDRIAVRRARAIVVDTYLLEAATRDVVERGIKRGIPIFVCLTTDSTAQRFARFILPGSSLALLCVAGNARAIESMIWVNDDNSDRHAARIAVLRGRAAQPRPETVSDICRSVKAKYVASIHDLRVTILAGTGEHLGIDLSDLSGFVRNQKGDSDALMAAVVDVFLTLSTEIGSTSPERVLDLNDRNVVNKLRAETYVHVQRAVGSYGATPGSVISFEEPFETWRRVLERQVKSIVMQAINAVGWLAIAISIDRLALLLAGEHILRVPFKKIGAVLGVVGKWLLLLLGSLFGH